jgi:hypothetical protein
MDTRCKIFFDSIYYIIFFLLKFKLLYSYGVVIVSSNSVHGEVQSIQHYVIMFVNDLRQVGGFLRVLRFPPPIKLTATI